MISKEYLIECFDNEKIASYLDGDWPVTNEEGTRFKMPYLSYRDICSIDSNVLGDKTVYPHSSRWIALLGTIKNAIENDQLVILLE